MVRMLGACSLVLCLVLGCGGDPQPEPAAVSGATLTVEQWKQLPISDKYDQGSFDRLRAHDPKLQDERQWDHFMREVVIPERQKDIPGIPGQ